MMENRDKGIKPVQIVGRVNKQVEKLLSLSNIKDRNIYFAPSNLEHMRTAHPEDFERYGDKLSEILSIPDYVGQNPNDGSIEYVKEFLVEGEYVKVAVRLSHSDKYFARSLYVLNKNRVERFIAKGTLKKT